MQWSPATCSPLHKGNGAPAGYPGQPTEHVQPATHTQPHSLLDDVFGPAPASFQQQQQQQAPLFPASVAPGALPTPSTASGSVLAAGTVLGVRETSGGSTPSLWSSGERPSRTDASLMDFLGASDLRAGESASSGPPSFAAADAAGESGPLSRIEVMTTRLILIRHGRSSWNEFLISQGVSHFSAGKVKKTHDAVTLGPDASDLKTDPKKNTGFWKGVRNGVKHVANATASVINHSETLSQVDHGLALVGVRQARQLRKNIAMLADGAPPAEGSPAAVLLACERWYVSPFLRCLQTAGYALSPLHKRRPGLQIVITPLANEIISSQLSLDCQGKKGNVGLRMVTRAVTKVAEAIDEEEDNPEHLSLAAERQAELAEVSATLCAMDLGEVTRTWWRDVGSWKKEHLKLEDARIRDLVARVLRDPAPVVGLVAHSLLFRRIIQLYCAKDLATQEAVRSGMRNGAPADTRDPFVDKVMNCGTLVLSFKYRHNISSDSIRKVEIVGAEFLFDGKMEGALSGEQQTLEVPQGEDALPMPEAFDDLCLDGSATADQ